MGNGGEETKTADRQKSKVGKTFKFHKSEKVCVCGGGDGGGVM